MVSGRQSHCDSDSKTIDIRRQTEDWKRQEITQKNLVYSEFWNQESETGGVKPSKFVTERNLKAAATNYDQISKEGRFEFCLPV